ncbi:MAG: DUF4293 domain-containing protein [Paludibacteraceae bacterium]|nr:DUF4293 domain-containing protein [Paludibacteraceae bacterium]
MIQRIQTLYLLLSIAVGVAQCFMPIAGFLTTDALWCEWSFNAWHMQSGELILSTWAMAILLITIPLVSLITLLLFKKRVLQMRLCVFNVVVMVGYYLLYMYYYWLVKQHVTVDPEMVRMGAMTLGSAFPLVEMNLTIMAMRRIWKDEVLVRSLNRLR